MQVGGFVLKSVLLSKGPQHFKLEHTKLQRIL